MDEVDRVEGAVYEPVQVSKVGGTGVHHEIVRTFVHQPHQLPRVRDDRLALAPCDGGGEEADHLGILPAQEGAR